jgi:hypothetical protein
MGEPRTLTNRGGSGSYQSNQVLRTNAHQVAAPLKAHLTTPESVAATIAPVCSGSPAEQPGSEDRTLISACAWTGSLIKLSTITFWSRTNRILMTRGSDDRARVLRVALRQPSVWSPTLIKFAAAGSKHSDRPLTAESTCEPVGGAIHTRRNVHFDDALRAVATMRPHDPSFFRQRPRLSVLVNLCVRCRRHRERLRHAPLAS